jgi:hypothetical protein
MASRMVRPRAIQASSLAPDKDIPSDLSRVRDILDSHLETTFPIPEEIRTARFRHSNILPTPASLSTLRRSNMRSLSIQASLNMRANPNRPTRHHLGHLAISLRRRGVRFQHLRAVSRQRVPTQA